MGSLIRRGGFDSAFFQQMTHDCEWLTVGGQPVADSTAQKTAQEKLLVTRNGHPPDVGPPLGWCVWGPIIQKAPRMPLNTQGGPNNPSK